ncbi:helix-turn-helix domain-containing protein [Streptacidiphilus fuscans]|uniref:Helix-turn-helix transcriptional regulator n=1 Tax=Streptacidiphilus fuscans TaxID=2789292 RepID=A0A931FD06_9ACTN|nr:helix-turn-helix transcriptional regulator [Streptacidiphilus fuscans]MBF9069048.1 helix-turn-helix transcriptional regulator [Streptacidiphilus fuscans]
MATERTTLGGTSTEGPHTNALASSPFQAALREAIQARGLSLERIQARLLAAGTPVSMATLSHWRSGRSQPERTGSLEALARLEDVLQVEAGALVSLLPPPRRRGRRYDPLSFAEAYQDEVSFARAFEEGAFDQAGGEHLADLSRHDRIEVGPDARIRGIWSRRVMRALEDGADRIMTLYRTDEGAPAPRIRAVRGCRLGRVVTSPKANAVVAELLFGQGLRRGEFAVMEHEVEFAAPFLADTSWEKYFDRPMREYVVEIQFSGPRLPSRCVQFSRPTVGDGRPSERSIHLDPHNRLTAAALDVTASCFGLRWDWDD